MTTEERLARLRGHSKGESGVVGQWGPLRSPWRFSTLLAHGKNVSGREEWSGGAVGTLAVALAVLLDASGSWEKMSGREPLAGKEVWRPSIQDNSLSTPPLISSHFPQTQPPLAFISAG
jgi:hypothetical protein